MPEQRSLNPWLDRPVKQLHIHVFHEIPEIAIPIVIIQYDEWVMKLPLCFQFKLAFDHPSINLTWLIPPEVSTLVLIRLEKNHTQVLTRTSTNIYTPECKPWELSDVWKRKENWKAPLSKWSKITSKTNIYFIIQSKPLFKQANRNWFLTVLHGSLTIHYNIGSWHVVFQICSWMHSGTGPIPNVTIPE